MGGGVLSTVIIAHIASGPAAVVVVSLVTVVVPLPLPSVRERDRKLSRWTWYSPRTIQKRPGGAGTHETDTQIPVRY